MNKRRKGTHFVLDHYPGLMHYNPLFFGNLRGIYD